LWLWKLFAVGYQVFQYWDIKSFYNQALKIDDSQLDSITWNEVQKRLVEAQSDYLMCIHKTQLTELDIYHRILRTKNYLVAMVNKELLPVRVNVPFVGSQFVFLSQGLKWNLEFLFFKGPWAPFEKWHLKEDYKKSNKRKELIDYLQNKIALVAMLNFVLMPLILFWQILYSFFNYAELVKREPGCLGVRKWSQYGRLYLRHFNEHDHELKSRLVRAYKPANQYMDFFVSPLAAVTARFITFIAGSILGVLLLLSVWDEDVLNVEHMLTIITVMGAIVAGARILIPDPNIVFCPEKTLTAVMAHIHYFPDSWKGEAHTSRVMSELGELFPYTAVYLLHEIISPILTPFILLFGLRSRSGAIVDFFRNFTVDVVGVGDVCSFAQMDVRRHGNLAWQQKGKITQNQNETTAPVESTAYAKAEDGKTEMSLLHFALTNPDWKPPQEEQTQFIQQLRCQVSKDAELLTTNNHGMQNGLPALPEETTIQDAEENILYASLNSLDAAGGIYSELANGILSDAGVMQSPSHFSRRRRATSPNQDSFLSERRGENDEVENLSQQGSLLQSIHQGVATGRSSILAMSQKWPSNGSIMTATGNTSQWLAPPPNLRQDLRRLGLEYTAADMSLSALYMHELHHRSTLNSHTSSRRGYPPPGGNVAIPASTEINASEMKKSSDCSQATSPRGHNRKYEKTSLIGLEEESIPLFDPANAFNSSTLEINVENSSTSDSSNSSASKYKVDLMHV
jgi:autophagy-related protein 9